jgi:hypothetical protein
MIKQHAHLNAFAYLSKVNLAAGFSNLETPKYVYERCYIGSSYF